MTTPVIEYAGVTKVFAGSGRTPPVTAIEDVSIIALTLIGIVAHVAVVLAERQVLHYLPRTTWQQF